MKDQLIKTVTSEDQLQANCFFWFNNTYPHLRGYLFHPANGGKRSKREANKMKAMGVLPGIPDLIFIYPLTGIELKFGKGTTSDSQKAIHNLWISLGIPIHIVRSEDEFQILIKKLIS